MRGLPGITESSSRALVDDFERVRALTESIIQPLEIEDLVIQAMDDVSPAKWHLAHTSWFFEEFILTPFLKSYKSNLDNSSRLFNSYYETVGDRIARPSRGHLSRPTVAEILSYRHHVTTSMLGLLSDLDSHENKKEILHRMEIGIHHEQQHQELLYTDLKFNLYQNPSRPAYLKKSISATRAPVPMQWIDVQGGLVTVGSDSGFSYDNERPMHRVYLENFQIASRLTTNAEYIQFMESGGYLDFKHWLSDGWDLVQTKKWSTPLYWEKHDGDWYEYTLSGMSKLDPAAPVTHVSFHEAVAFASWSGKRLLTEFEWEHASSLASSDGNFLESGLLRPSGAIDQGLTQMFGDVWEWTTSAYLPYPGFKPLSGALGEYNGKFMNDQRVLRGGSCVTSRSHIRQTYRNFFQGDKRWQFSGIRLAS